MSDTEESSTSCDWIPYSERPEWKDVTPLLQNEGLYPVVQIAYSDKFRDIFNYFRAVLAKEEISERAFQLSEDAAWVNPASYTVWQYRRRLLKELNLDLNEEFELCKQFIEDFPKNYQVWYHRQMLVELTNDPSREKKLTESVLLNDAKNYHAWQHRQWVIKTFSLWENELVYVNCLLEEDVRNNSAWNQRYFVISNSYGMSEEVIKEEIKYTIDCIKKAPHNESPWNYLRGILHDKGLSKYPEVTTLLDELHSSGNQSPHLLGFMIDVMEEQLLAGGDQNLCTKAVALCDLLANKQDTIRKEYWNYVARNLGNLYGPEEAHVHVNE